MYPLPPVKISTHVLMCTYSRDRDTDASREDESGDSEEPGTVGEDTGQATSGWGQHTTGWGGTDTLVGVGKDLRSPGIRSHNTRLLRNVRAALCRRKRTFCLRCAPISQLQYYLPLTKAPVHPKNQYSFRYLGFCRILFDVFSMGAFFGMLYGNTA